MQEGVVKDREDVEKGGDEGRIVVTGVRGLVVEDQCQDPSVVRMVESTTHATQNLLAISVSSRRRLRLSLASLVPARVLVIGTPVQTVAR